VTHRSYRPQGRYWRRCKAKAARKYELIAEVWDLSKWGRLVDAVQHAIIFGSGTLTVVGIGRLTPTVTFTHSNE
jgi:hypothetical protein